MAVVSPQRFTLRGRIRAQTQYAVVLTERLLTAHAKNGTLHLFQGDTGPGSVADMQYMISVWRNALSARS